MPYSKSVIGERMNPIDRHDWQFVADFVAACASADRRTRESLLSTARSQWEAADPKLAPPDAQSSAKAGELQIREYERRLEVATRQHEGAQRMVDKHQHVINALMYVLGQMSTAHAVLVRDRDTLRSQVEQERTARHNAEEQLRRLTDIELRMKATEEKRVLAEQKLAEAHQQLARAQLLRSKAIVQQLDAEDLLGDSADQPQPSPLEQNPSGDLMDDTDQMAADQVLDNVQHVLDESAQDLDRLEGELNASRQGTPVQPPSPQPAPADAGAPASEDQDDSRIIPDNPTSSADMADNARKHSPPPDGMPSPYASYGNTDPATTDGLPTVDELLARIQAPRARSLVSRELPMSASDDLNDLAVRRHLATTYSRTGSHEQAIPILEQVADDYARVIGRNHYKTLATYHELAINHGHVGNYERAISVLRQVITAYEQSMGHHHTLTEQARQNLKDLEHSRDETQGLVWVTMPKLDESITEHTVTRWLRQPGDPVQVDELLLEVSTDMIDTTIPSPATGIQKITVEEDETVEVGTQLTCGPGRPSSGRWPRAATGAGSAPAST